MNSIKIVPSKLIEVSCQCWFSGKESDTRIQMEKAAALLNSKKHSKISKIVAQVVQTTEKSVGFGGGIYIVGNTGEFKISSTIILKFDKKGKIRGDILESAEKAFDQLCQNIGSGFEKIATSTFW